MTETHPTGPGPKPAGAAGVPASTAGAAPDPAADPSMEDILASIRRILSEDETKSGASTATSAAGHEADDVLVLDSSMLVDPPVAAVPAIHSEPTAAVLVPVAKPASPKPAAPAAAIAPPYFAPEPAALTASALPAAATGAVTQEPAQAAPVAPQVPGQTDLVAPAAAAAAASAVGSLLKHLQQERQSAVYRGGPTIEDVVREEMRPILKEWLDAHLPPLVERLVRAEIERVVARSVS